MGLNTDDRVKLCGYQNIENKCNLSCPSHASSGDPPGPSGLPSGRPAPPASSQCFSRITFCLALFSFGASPLLWLLDLSRVLRPHPQCHMWLFSWPPYPPGTLWILSRYLVRRRAIECMSPEPGRRWCALGFTLPGSPCARPGPWALRAPRAHTITVLPNLSPVGSAKPNSLPLYGVPLRDPLFLSNMVS